MINQSEIEILNRFIPALVQKHNELQLNNLRSDQIHLKSLFSELNTIDTKRQAYIKANAPYFNIFDILRYGHYETRLHTPFLVHLLNPVGNHLFEKQFLILFIDYIFERQFETQQLKNIEVIEELQAECLSGRIDIFIRFSYLNEYYFVAIENKIDAGDQEEQLNRYYDYLNLQTSNRDKIRLVYLTKYGVPPSIPNSIDLENYNKLINENVLKLLSYRNEIHKFINLLLQRDNPHSVSEILKQYMKTINSF